MRAAMRRVQQAVNGQLTLTRLPADPPPLKVTRQYHVTGEYVLVANAKDKANEIIYRDPPQVNAIKVGQESGGYKTISLGCPDLAKLFSWGLGMTSAQHAQSTEQFIFGLKKVSLWGPLPQVGSMRLSLHVGNGQTVCVATDYGSPVSRPRCAITSMREEWSGSSASDIKISVNLDPLDKHPSPTSELGILRITLAGRLHSEQ